MLRRRRKKAIYPGILGFIKSNVCGNGVWYHVISQEHVTWPRTFRSAAIAGMPS